MGKQRQLRSKGPASVSEAGEEATETKRSDGLRGARRGVGYADHRARFQGAKRH